MHKSEPSYTINSRAYRSLHGRYLMPFYFSARKLFKALLCHLLTVLLVLNSTVALNFVSNAHAQNGQVPDSFSYDEEIDFTNTGFFDVMGQIVSIVSGIWAILSMIPPCLPNPNCTPPIPVVSYNLSNTSTVVSTILSLTDYTYQGERLVKKIDVKYNSEQSDQAQIDFHQKALDELLEQYEFVERIATRAKLMLVVQGTVVGFAIAEVIVKWAMVASHTASMNAAQAGLWAEEGMTCNKAGKLVKDALGISAALAVLTGFFEGIWTAIKSVFISTAGEQASKSFFEKYGAEIRLAFALLGMGFATYTFISSRDREEEVKKRVDSYKNFIDQLNEKLKPAEGSGFIRRLKIKGPGFQNFIDTFLARVFASAPETKNQAVSPEMNTCYTYSGAHGLKRDKACLCKTQQSCMKAHIPDPSKLTKNSPNLAPLSAVLKLTAQFSSAVFNGNDKAANSLAQEIIEKGPAVDVARKKLMQELKELKANNPKFKMKMQEAEAKAKNFHQNMMNKAHTSWKASGSPVLLASLIPMKMPDKLVPLEYAKKNARPNPSLPDQPLDLGTAEIREQSPDKSDYAENDVVVTDDEINLNSSASIFEIISRKYMQKMFDLQK